MKHGYLSVLYNFVQFPWERLILLLIVGLGGGWMYGKFSRCQQEVYGVVQEAEYIANSAPCNEKKDLFKNAVDCGEFTRKLAPEYQEEIWWSCFLNTFIFYRTWLGLGVFAFAIFIAISICKPSSIFNTRTKYKPRKIRYRNISENSLPRLEYLRAPLPRLPARPRHRLGSRSRSQEYSDYSDTDSNDYSSDYDNPPARSSSM